MKKRLIFNKDKFNEYLKNEGISYKKFCENVKINYENFHQIKYRGTYTYIGKSTKERYELLKSYPFFHEEKIQEKGEVYIFSVGGFYNYLHEEKLSLSDFCRKEKISKGAISYIFKKRKITKKNKICWQLREYPFFKKEDRK